MTATLTTASAILKRLYPLQTLPLLLAKESPTYGMLPKGEDFYGEDASIPVTYAPTSGRSAQFSTAQANAGAVKRTKFLLTRVEDFATFKIEGHALRAASKDKGSLTPLLKDEGDRTWDNLMKSMCHALFNNGGGAIATVRSTSGMALTLGDPSQAVNIEVGQKIVSSATDGLTGSADAEVATVTGVDEDLGIIYRSDANWITGGNFADGDFLFTEGDFGLKMKGLPAWVPATTPTTGDSFFGVDRSVHPTKLAGWRHVANTDKDGTLERMWINAAAKIGYTKGRPDLGIMNHLDLAMLINELGSKVYYERMQARGTGGSSLDIGYDAIKLHTGAGVIKIIGDHYCPRHTAYLLQMNTWKIWSCGPAPGWLDEDNVGNILRLGSANAYEGRLGLYWQMYTHHPYWNMTINTSAITNPTA